MRFLSMASLACVLAVGLLCGCAATGETDRDSGVPQLKVVRTWNDLLRQPSLRVADDEVKLGIEATECPAGTGLLVYCLEMAPGKVRRIAGRKPGEPLGPVFVKTISLEGGVVEADTLEQSQWHGDEQVPALYAVGVQTRQTKNYEVRVLTQDGTVLAARKIQATPPEPLPWLTFEPGERVQQPGASHYSLSDAPAVPRWEGRAAIEKAVELPHFFPTREDPTLDVSVKGSVVTVKSPRWVNDELSEYWLIRWWVNGKPVLREPGEGRHSHIRVIDDARQIVEPTEFSFHLDVDRKRLGANPGDVVEFQLLYCRDGLDFPGREEKVMHLWRERLGGDNAVRLSKRLRWE